MTDLEADGIKLLDLEKQMSIEDLRHSIGAGYAPNGELIKELDRLRKEFTDLKRTNE